MTYYPSYEAIRAYYGRQVAERSQKPLIEHIEEGLVILDCMEAIGRVREAWCMHPMVQSDEALAGYYSSYIQAIPQDVVILAMEYRYRANNWLSDKVYINPETNSCEAIGKPEWSMSSTRLMLIADKVQNYKDFCAYHADTHPRSRELRYYFLTWLEALQVTPEDLKRYYAAIDTRKAVKVEEQ